MTNVFVDQHKNAKCGELKVDWWECCCWNSPDGRRFATIEGRPFWSIEYQNFWLLDLFHMTKMKFSISSNCLPKSQPYVTFRALDWFHENKAFVVIEVFDYQTDMYEFYSALIDIDHDRLRCVLRDVQSLDKSGERQRNVNYCKLLPLRNSIGVVLIGARSRSTILHVFSNSADGEPKWTKRILLPDGFCPVGVLDEFIYGFSRLPELEIDVPKLVKVCIETNEQTTLDVETPLGWRVDWMDFSWVCIGRKLVTNLPVQPFARIYSRHELCIFDVDSLRWSQLKCKFDDSINQLIYDRDNILIVTTPGWRNGHVTGKIYRFAINRPDTLANSSWIAIRNHAKTSPGFDRHVLSLLPKNSPFHCVLGTRASIEHPSSSAL